MNIKEAKQEIIHTIQAYTYKDTCGHYRIPTVHQRPILLIGPPGIGKTAVMEQAAQECEISLVSYTMTHHTRQSAIGLPVIETREYEGQSVPVTEYTMSEILASVYDVRKQSGCQEGILFLDEINCVSETLAPAMLQFLQSKVFGSHQLPEGWIIAAAGNPPEYNKSVREFDIATLDRVKRITVTEDLNVWKEYAAECCIHPAILAYLEIKNENFYALENKIHEKYFVTARGWEDLSRILLVYEELHIPATEQLILQYLQHPSIARDFSDYLSLYYKYQELYPVQKILGSPSEKDLAPVVSRLHNAPFEEKISLIHMLAHQLKHSAATQRQQQRILTRLQDGRQRILQNATSGEISCLSLLDNTIIHQKEILSIKQENHLLDTGEAEELECFIRWLEHKKQACKAFGFSQPNELLELMDEDISRESQTLQTLQEQFSQQMANCIAFMETTFSGQTELFLLLSELSLDPACTRFFSAYPEHSGSHAYAKYQTMLQFQQQQTQLVRDIDAYLAK